MNGQGSTESMDWRDRQALSGTELNDFLALRRVCGHPRHRVDQVGDRFVGGESPLLPFLADGVATLIEVGHLALGEPDRGSHASRPVVVTTCGRARYEDLCERQGVPPYPTSGTSRAWCHQGENDDLTQGLHSPSAPLQSGAPVTRDDIWRAQQERPCQEKGLHRG